LKLPKPHSFVPVLTLLSIIAAPCGAASDPQTYPNRPIRFIVPYAAGGNTDLIARVLGQKLTERWGQTVVVDNRPGAGTLIGTELVARAPADGYTILLATIATHAINPHLHEKVPYDAFRDFAPVVLVARGPFTVVVPPSSPARSMKDLVSLAKAQPGKLAFGSGGPGSPQHMAVEIFKSVVQVDITHVPYKGSAPAITDLLGGQIGVMFDNTAMQHVKSGKLRAIATTGVTRMTLAPDVATVREQGIPYDFYTWQGVAAPANTPPAIVDKLNSEMARALKMPDVQAKLTGDGAEIMAGPPKEFADWIKVEYGRMQKAVKASGAKAY
jgi:tripartite-type tricarboxylate transporter receptor subunit TctC